MYVKHWDLGVRHLLRQRFVLVEVETLLWGMTCLLCLLWGDKGPPNLPASNIDPAVAEDAILLHKAALCALLH